MSDLQQIIVLATNILQHQNNQLRTQSQKLLKQLRDSTPNQFVILFINLLESNQTQELRMFAATQLRKNLSSFSQASFKNIWLNLNQDTQNFVKIKLFQILNKEQLPTLRNIITDAIGQIAGSVLNANAQAWSNFKQNIWYFFSVSSTEANQSGFRILETFFSYAPQIFANNINQLYELFKNSFIHTDNKVKISGMKAFSSYLSTIQTKKISQFQDLAIPLYQIIYHLLINDNHNQQGLVVLTDIVDTQPKFLKKSFLQLNQLIYNVVMISDLEDGSKRMATQLLISFAQRYPAFYRQHKDKLTILIQIIFLRMIDIQTNISDQWKSPPEGYNQQMEEDDDYQTTRFGMTSIDRLISAIGEQQMLPLLSAIVQKMLSAEDWRYKYAAVMALSQVGQYIQQVQNIKPIIGILCNMMNDSNPMLRYACCHAFGQISDDMQTNFQQIYSNDVFPRLLNALQDPIPRVVSHAAAALTNFIQGMTYQQIQSSLDKLIEILLNLVQNGISLIKESAMSALASAAEISDVQFIKYYETSIPILFDVLSKPLHQTKQYKQLKGQTIQTLTLIASAVKKDVFRPVAQKLIEYLIALQSSNLQQVDPQKTYVLTGWQRLCIVFGQQLGSSLDKILPSLFKLVTNVLETNLKNSSLDNIVSEKQVEQNINTYETEEAQVAISMLNVFIEKLKHHYLPYVEATVKLLCPIIKQHPNQNIKKQACKCLPSLIASLKGTNSPQAVDMAKLFIETLIETAEKQFDSDLITGQIQALKQVISQLDLKFLSSEQLNTLSQRIIKLLLSSDQRKSENKKIKQQQELEPEQNQLIDDQIKLQQEVQVGISELIGALFKTHKQMTMSLTQYIINNVLPRVFDDLQSDNMHKFGIFLIDDMVQFLGYELLSTRWNDFAVALIKFSTHKNVVVRQAACYGLGIYSQRTPSQAFKPILEQILSILFQSSKIPKGTQKQKAYGHCRDNAIASIGKIIKAHGAQFDPKPVLRLWLNLLPLKFDKDQAHIQHEFLSDIVLNNAQLLISDNQEGKIITIKILSIFGDILQTKVCNDSIKEKIKLGLNKLKTTNFFISNFNLFWQQLTGIQKKRLTQLMK